MKKIVLSTVVLVTLGVSAAEQIVKGVTWYYEPFLSGGKSYARIVSGVYEYAGDLTIPSALGGRPVMEIGDRAFYSCSRLTSVVIPDGVTSVGDDAFNYCRELRSVTIPSSVTSIGEDAFRSCSGLLSVTIPSGVMSIGVNAFRGCSGLGGGVVIVDGCVLTVNGTCPSSVVLPQGVRMIAGGAFAEHSGLESVTIPSSVTSIGADAFRGCNGLWSATISEGVTDIGESAFRDCDGLLAVTIPSSVTCVGDSAFEDCGGLISVVISEGVVSIGDGTFEGCSDLMSVEIPSSIKSIGNGAFCNCFSLKSVVLPPGLTNIGDELFPCCHCLEFADIPSNVTNIGDSAFNWCEGLTSVVIPSNVVRIGRAAFAYSYGLTTVTMLEGVRVIDGAAFSECYGLTSVTIPSSVMSIGKNAFGYCENLKIVYVDKDDGERIKALLQDSGFDVSGVDFISFEDEPEAKKWVLFYKTPKEWIAGRSTIEMREVDEGAALGLLPTASMDGYTPDGWWVIDKNWEGGKWGGAYKSRVDADTIVTEDMVICGKWITNTYHINFDANGGSVSPEQILVEYEDVVGDLPTPILSGCLFRGWYTTDGRRFPSEVLEGNAEEGYYYSTPSDLTVSACWGKSGETPLPQYGPWGEAEAVKNPDKLGPTMLTDMTLELNGAAGAVGDVVAAFRGDTGALCGLGKVMDGSGTLTMACYAPTGTRLHFQVWLSDSGMVNPIIADCNAKSDLTAPTSGAFLSGHALVVSDDKDLTISLGSADWHTVSFNVLPEDPSPAAVFGSVKAKIAAVTQGIEFWMPGKTSSLKAIEIGKGYWVNTKVDDVEWTVSGKTDPKAEIALEEGWNLVGYAPEAEGAVQAVLKTALAAKAVDYVTYGVEFYPGGTLKKMEPGKAYWVHATKAYTLVYDDGAALKAVRTPLLRSVGAAVPTYGPWGESEAVKNPDKLGPTFLTDMAVEIDGEPAAYGDVVAVFRGDTGALCGLGKVMDDSGTLTVVCYAPKGVTLSFKVWLAESGVEEAVVVKCDNASKLVAPESGAFYAGHEISCSTAELIETIVPGEKVEIDTELIGYTVSGLPAGLTYNRTTGMITGAATKPGEYAVKFTKSGVEAEEMAIVVKKGPEQPVEPVNPPSTDPPIECNIKVEYRTKADVGVIPVKVVNVKETVKIAVKGLPSGVKFTAKDVKATAKSAAVPANSIYGTPTKSGVYAATVTVTPTDKKSKMAPIVKTLMFVVRNAGEHIVRADCDAAQGTVKGMGVYAPGKKVTLKATAAKGWVFSGWYDGDALVSRLASYVLTMPDEDVNLTARFVTVAADKKSIGLKVNGTALSGGSGQKTASPLKIVVKQGMYVEWPVAASALSATTVKVSGLPSGLKFTVKDVKATKTSAAVPANTIYGTPKTASKVDKNGKSTPSKVKITVTTAGKAKQEYVINVTVRGIPAEGTFNGGSASGLVTLTVAKTGKISGKYLADGKTWTLSAAGFDTWDDHDRLTATLTAKSGKEMQTVALVYEDGYFSSPLFEAWRNEWKVEPQKSLAAKLKGQKVTVGEDGNIVLTIGASGAVTAKGTFWSYSASCSTVLIPTESKGTYMVYLYFPPKAGKFGGWVGTAHITAE